MSDKQRAAAEILEACDYAEERINEFLERCDIKPRKEFRLFGEEMPYAFEHEWSQQHARQTLEYMDHVSETLREEHAVYYAGEIVDAVAALVCIDLDVHSEVLEEGGQRFAVIASGSGPQYQLEAESLSNEDIPRLEEILYGNSKLRSALTRQQSEQADADLERPGNYTNLSLLIDGMEDRLKRVYEGCLELKEEIAEARKVLAEYQLAEKAG